MKILTILLALASQVVLAAPAKYDASRLFVKTDQIQKLQESNHVLKVTHLFKDRYIVSTDNLELLEEFLKQEKMSFERNYFAGEKELPKVTEDTLPRVKNDAPLFSFFNDPLVEKIWSFQDRTKHGVSVNEYYLTPLNQDRAPIVVSVVDTGVEYTHDDLQDNMWVNTREIPRNGIDDDGNGYVDDIYGINTLKRDSNDIASGDPIPTHPHGTHVAGTIAATQNNNLGIAGIASTTKIMAIRAVPNRSDETDADIVESFLYAAKHGAKIINCSFGKSHNEGGNIVNETITHIGEEYGVLVFASAGNEYGRNIDRKPKYPASFDSDYLVVIASTTSSGNLSNFSNIGKKSVDIAAPGSSIYSTILNQKFGYMSGTSMAAPTAVGVAAELWANFPDLDALTIKSILMQSVVKVPRFKNKIKSGGRIDLSKSIQFALENYIDL